MISHKVITCLSALLLIVATEKNQADTPKQHNARDRELAAADARREMEFGQQDRAQAGADMEARVADERRNLERETYEFERELIEQRMREVELQAAAKKLELEGNIDEWAPIQRELVQVRTELERHELQLELRRLDVNRQAERYEMLRMRDRLEYVSDWRGVAFDPQEAVMMATQAVVESAFAGGGSERASDLLEGLLGEIRDVGSRTAIRFALRDLYDQSGRPDAATEHLKEIILENARGLDGDHDGGRR